MNQSQIDSIARALVAEFPTLDGAVDNGFDRHPVDIAERICGAIQGMSARDIRAARTGVDVVAVPRCIIATTDKHEQQFDGNLYAHVALRFNPQTMTVEPCAHRMIRIDYDDIDRDGIAHVVIGRIGSALVLRGAMPAGVILED